jgi:hypothetical protein
VSPPKFPPLVACANPDCLSILEADRGPLCSNCNQHNATSVTTTVIGGRHDSRQDSGEGQKLSDTASSPAAHLAIRNLAVVQIRFPGGFDAAATLLRRGVRRF